MTVVHLQSMSLVYLLILWPNVVIPVGTQKHITIRAALTCSTLRFHASNVYFTVFMCVPGHFSSGI